MPVRIKFGTDGWRGIMADDFTFENVRLVSGAVADYIKDHRLANKGIIIGFDNRFMSDRFAAVASEVMAKNKIPVFKTQYSTPTPVTAYGVKSRGTAGAVMITASHNPPEYNGMKFIPDYAGPASPEITGEIEKNLEARRGKLKGSTAGKWQQEAAMSLSEKYIVEAATKHYVGKLEQEKAEIKEVDLFADYALHMKDLIDVKAIKQAGLKVIVDPMYGCGIGYLDGMLREAGADVVEIQCRRDPLFGGHLPEPSEKLVEGLKKRVLSEKAHLGLALDGDADRFGIIDANGKYITPNEFLPLVYYHLLKKRGMTGPVTRTVATTHLLDKMAKRFGQEIFETPVGFKYIAQNLMERGCILGGEESGGLSIKGHIPEKDGLLAGLLAVEIIAVNGKSLGRILKELHTQFGSVYSKRLDVHTTPENKDKVLENMRQYEPREFGGVSVFSRSELDGVKFVLQDGSWVLIRASGTEPVFRIYAEGDNEEKVKNLHLEACKKFGIKEN